MISKEEKKELYIGLINYLEDEETEINSGMYIDFAENHDNTLVIEDCLLHVFIRPLGYSSDRIKFNKITEREQCKRILEIIKHKKEGDELKHLKNILIKGDK